MKIISWSNRLIKSKNLINCSFLQMPFRPFFLLGAFFSLISIIVWALLFTGQMTHNVFENPVWWHMHEMLFGFVCAIIIGFLLTAVQNWTQIPGIHGYKLGLLVLLWLSARVMFLLPAYFPSMLISVVDLAFLPVCALLLAMPIIKAELWRNLMFVPILLLMTSTNALMHFATYSNSYQQMTIAINMMIMLVVLLMTILGGRVFPMFTANGTQTAKVEPIGWLEKLSIFSIIVLIFLRAELLEITHSIEASFYFLAAVAHSIRLIRWRIWVALKTPLVWSLHIAYGFIPVGLFLTGLSMISDSVSQSQATHALTVGAIGAMILSMISRVSLGHTGRKLAVGKLMTFAFIAMICAAIWRVFGFYWLEQYQHVIIGASVLWFIAYSCFCALFLPILTQPRK